MALFRSFVMKHILFVHYKIFWTCNKSISNFTLNNKVMNWSPTCREGENLFSCPALPITSNWLVINSRIIGWKYAWKRGDRFKNFKHSPLHLHCQITYCDFNTDRLFLIWLIPQSDYRNIVSNRFIFKRLTNTTKPLCEITEGLCCIF